MANKRRRHTIESLKKEAKERGWKLLDEKYKGGAIQHTFICDNGHKIQKTVDNFLRKSPCRICSGNIELTIEIFKEEAKKRNWELLDNTYSGKTQIFKFKCLICNTKFELKSSSVRGKKATKNCPNCSPTKKLTIKILAEQLKGRGIKLLSKKYTSIEAKYEYQCQYNHVWKARASDVLHKNSGCPHCRFFKMEEKVRYLFEQYFNTKFKKTKILNGKLELDGYSKKLQLAFEYNGEQHYKIDPYFFKTKGGFLSLKERDKQKVAYCITNNIDIIVIPYTEKSNKALVEFIAKKMPKQYEVNISKMKSILTEYGKDSHLLVPIRKQLKKVGMELISKNYTHATAKDLKVRCKKCGYTKCMSKNWIEQGNGCHRCSGQMPYTISELKEVSRKKGGKLISTTYTPGEKVTWECSKGHRWNALPNSVKDYNRKGTWCPECAHNKLGSNEKVLALAKERGHKVLEGKYESRQSIFKFKCPKGDDHIWSARFISYQRSKNGCRICSNKDKPKNK